MLVNDTDVGGSFGVFSEGQFTDDAGKAWTTFQFSPNPVAGDSDHGGAIHQAWLQAARALPPGEHRIRFELWCQLGQFESREPLAVGEFDLAVQEGQRVAATGSFPRDSYGGGDVDAVSMSRSGRCVIGPRL
ncbi:MAG: hypothetical protein QGF53_04770 [Alphaproteobacteria bacterium]|nr:hypothetical protein [Alphaproteobacteria bacterium]